MPPLSPVTALLLVGAAAGCGPSPPTEGRSPAPPIGAETKVIGRASAPVRVAMAITPRDAPPGGECELRVTVRVAPSWEIGPLGDDGADPKATRLHADPPAGIGFSGDWDAPPTTPSTRPGGRDAYTGEVVFTRLLWVADDVARDELAIVCRVVCQACDDRRCVQHDTTATVAVRVVSPDVSD